MVSAILTEHVLASGTAEMTPGCIALHLQIQMTSLGLSSPGLLRGENAYKPGLDKLKFINNHLRLFIYTEKRSMSGTTEKAHTKCEHSNILIGIALLRQIYLR